MKMKQLKLSMLCFTLLGTLTGCNNTNSNIKVTVLGDSIVELPTVTSIDYEKGLKNDKQNYGKFGCSAIGKVLENGDMIVGRSLDLYYSNNPAYVIRTNVEGYYKTIGLAYNNFIGSNFSTVKENGITQDELLNLLFFSTDTMNEKGLYIEANMRPEQPENTGIVKSTGTKPGASLSMSLPALVRYLIERCDSVTSAVEMANTINVYGMITDKFAWGGGYFMADSTGHYGVLELVDNKLIWNENYNCQTNYYLNDEYKDKATIGTGLGRYDYLQEHIDSVKSEEDMKSLIKKVRYSQILDPYNCPFDPTSESCGYGNDSYKDFGGQLTIQMIRSGEYKEKILAMMEETGSQTRKKTIQQLKDEGKEWLSAYQTVANCNKKTFSVTFFEDDTLSFDFKLD